MNLSEPVNAQAVAQSVGKYRWTICALLFFATTVNYLDRQV
jgi:ACS family hexuronate transporter-like MFS transporter